MKLSKPQSDFEIAPAGTHTAVLYRIIDLGTQTVETQWGTKEQHKGLFMWELPDELMEDGRPFSVAKRYTLSLHEKSAFYKDVKTWTGNAPDEGFEPRSLLGKACNITLTHTENDGKTYTNVSSIAPLKKTETAPAPTNDILYFDLDDYDDAVFKQLSDGLRDVISKSPEYQEATSTTLKVNGVDADLDDEIPF